MSIVDSVVAIVAPYLYIFFLTGLFVYLFQKKYNFQSLLPIALISTTLFVFIFTGLFHSITIAFLITVVAALGFIPFLILDKNRSRVLKGVLFTPGFMLFSILYAFVVALAWFKVIPLLSDSSMHWAPHVWTMWLRDDFYTSPGVSIVIHGDYPPAVQLFELLWSKAAGVYHEGLLFAAIQILSFSMLLPAFGRFTWQEGKKLKSWLLLALFATALIALPLLFFVSAFYSTLEVDAILAFIFAYGLYLAISESKKFSLTGVVKLSLLVTFLCLTKQIAILLAGPIVLVYLSNLYLSYRHQFTLRSLFAKRTQYLKRWGAHWKSIVIVLFAIIFPVFGLKLWSAQITGYSSPDKGVAIFHLELADTLQIPSIIAHKSGSEAQQNFSRGFFKHLFLDPGGFLLNNIGGISYMQVVLVFIGLMIFVGYVYNEKLSRYKIALLTIIVTPGWFLYCFAIYAVFLFGGMKEVEMNNLDTSNRYLRTYLFAMLLIAAMLLFHKLVEDQATKAQSKAVTYFAVVLIALFGLFFNKDTMDGLGRQSMKANKNELASLNMDVTKSNLNKVAELSNGTFKDPAKLLVTATSDNERHYLQYNALPNRISVLLFDKMPTQESVCNALRNNDYFVVGYYYTDEADWAMIKTCLTADVEFSQGSVYKIIVNDKQVSLVAI
jgi:hypothetical protein